MGVGEGGLGLVCELLGLGGVGWRGKEEGSEVGLLGRVREG